MKRYKYILFDLDGTLTDPEEGITKSIAHGLEKMGMENICCAWQNPKQFRR